MLYLDASALVKRILAEPESAELGRLLTGEEPLVSSRIAAVEVILAVKRAVGTERLLERARRSVGTLELRQVDDEVVTLAQEGPPIRSLDAIHLATALTLRQELSAFVAYDRRLLAAARDAGLPVLAPGAAGYS